MTVDFYPANSAFQYCEYVNFVDSHQEGNNLVEAGFASDPLAWFDALRKRGTDTLRMHYGPSARTQPADRMLVGFVGGGGRWLVESQTSGMSDLWEARWQVGDRSRQDRKIWRVTYARFAKNQRPIQSPALEHPERLLQDLDRLLIAMEEFSRTQGLDNFATLFARARTRLHSDPPYSDQYHSDLIRTDLLPLAACKLLAACQDAWVFGGMGSWNDQGFDADTQPRYEALSEELYQLLNRAIVVAANSSCYGTLT